ncbi:MAG: hypothetical protein Q9217_004381 [Psora testacea]
MGGLVRTPSTPLQRKASLSESKELQPSPTPAVNCRITPARGRALQSIAGNNNNPVTPHTIRALQQRRATPWYQRQKSGGPQRETPRDALRTLSRIFARTIRESRPPEDEDYSEKPSLERQTLSLVIERNGSNDDSFNATPPRLSMPIGDEEQTMRSIEVARGEAERSRLSRESFGNTQKSDRFDDVSALGVEGASKLGTVDRVIPPIIDEELDEGSRLTHRMDFGGDTEDLRQTLPQDAGQRDALLSATEPDQHIQADTYSSFVLDIPDFDPQFSKAKAIEPANSLCEEPLKLAEMEQASEEDPLQSEVFACPVALAEPSRKPIVRKLRKSNPLKYSRHGITYTALPPGITKNIAATFARSIGNRRSRVNKDTLDAIVEAGDLFLEQLSGDLELFAKHAGRKTIDEMDVMTVMKR